MLNQHGLKGEGGEALLVKVKSVSFPFRFIPAGSFEMGSKKGVGYDDERPRHRVRITRPFLLGETPVTQAQWVAVMGNNPSHFKGDRRPVEEVSWFDCVRFCNKLSEAEGLRAVYQIGAGDKPEVGMDRSANGYRLPTEAEWEYAAKAGTELTYAGSNNLGEVGWYGENSGGETHPVGGKKANGWGLYDMSGNVWEWCSDEFDSSAYAGRRSGVDDPISYRPGASGRVFRGGSWIYYAGSCRVSFRDRSSPDRRCNYLGWRLPRSL